MPSSIYGYTGSEIISICQDYVGNQDSTFAAWLAQKLPMAEMRFCKIHDWRFLHVHDIELDIENGESEYELDSSTVGYYIAAQDIENVYDPTNGLYLQKRSLEWIRKRDPEGDEGSASDYPKVWAPTHDNSILLWPPTFADNTLKIDAKITPSALFTASNYPTIPLRYQDSFICYMEAIALDHENDTRAEAKKMEAMALIRQDIQNDRNTLSLDLGDRIKTAAEISDQPASMNDMLSQMFSND